VLGLAVAPFLFPGVKALNVAAKVLIFVVLVAGFDLLLGYTGIVSFAHTMFFGIGAYGVAIAMHAPRAHLGGAGGGHWRRRWCCRSLLSLAIGLFSLRVRAIFFAMITLAVAAAFQTLRLAAVRIHRRRGRPDLQAARGADAELRVPSSSRGVLGVSDRRQDASPTTCCSWWRWCCFWRCCASSTRPFGRVLQAIRENEFRAEAIGYRVVVYRTLSSVLSALFACLAGAMLAIWLRYNGPDTSLSFEIMMDVLLIVVIGGMGTMYGAVIGSVLFLLAQSYLQDLLRIGSEATAGIPLLPALLSPDRWLLWLGVLFVLSVYYFPTGVVGKLRALRAPTA
jgi:branched-chain amino acid transport system permease protein